MELITKEQRELMLKNGKEMLKKKGTKKEPKFWPVVKLFTPDAQCTWLLSELDPDDENIAFGLCDLGMQCPELGYVWLSEIKKVRGQFRLPVERDLHFEATKSLVEYANEARAAGQIIA